MVGAVELINGWFSGGVAGPVLAAPIVGSFCGVLIARLPHGRGVVRGRSACPACGHTLGWAELVPVGAFLALRGRCLHCRAPIARFHLWVELAALGVALSAAACGARDAQLWAGCVLGWTLLTLAWIDAVCLRLPDVLTLPLVLAGLAEAWWLEPEVLTDRAVAAALCYGVLSGLAWCYRRLRGRDGLGLGDAKLAACGGAWLGLAPIPTVLLIAASGGLAWALRKGRPDPSARLPFGPFLAAAIWAVWLLPGPPAG